MESLTVDSEVLSPNIRCLDRRETADGLLEQWIVPFERWRRGISTLWSHLDTVDTIGPFDNAHGIVEYVGRDVFSRMLCFPVEMRLDGRPIGWVSTYNISESAIRIRGLYVDPKYRGKGLGFIMCDAAVAIWPAQFEKCYGLWRDTAFPTLQKRWGLREVEGYKPRQIYVFDKISGRQRLADYRVIFAYKDLAKTH